MRVNAYLLFTRNNKNLSKSGGRVVKPRPPFQQSSRRGCAERRGININKKTEPMKMKMESAQPRIRPPVQTGGMEQPFIGTPCGRRHGRRTAGGGETVTTLTF